MFSILTSQKYSQNLQSVHFVFFLFGSNNNNNLIREYTITKCSLILYTKIFQYDILQIHHPLPNTRRTKYFNKRSLFNSCTKLSKTTLIL